jgi:hypothetical protein
MAAYAEPTIPLKAALDLCYTRQIMIDAEQVRIAGVAPEKPDRA